MKRSRSRSPTQNSNNDKCSTQSSYSFGAKKPRKARTLVQQLIREAKTESINEVKAEYMKTSQSTSDDDNKTILVRP